MLGIISMAGNALRSFGSIHPAIKWGIVAIVGLLAVEFIGNEAIDLYAKLATVRAQVEVTTTDNQWKVYDNCLKQFSMKDMLQGHMSQCDNLKPQLGDKTATPQPWPSDPVLSSPVTRAPVGQVSNDPLQQNQPELPDAFKPGDASKLSPESRARLQSLDPLGVGGSPNLRNTKHPKPYL